METKAFTFFMVFLETKKTKKQAYLFLTHHIQDVMSEQQQSPDAAPTSSNNMTPTNQGSTQGQGR